MNVLLSETVSYISSPFAASDRLVVSLQILSFFSFPFFTKIFFFHASELRPDQWWLPHQNTGVICAQRRSAVCASNMKRKKKKKVVRCCKLKRLQDVFKMWWLHCYIHVFICVQLCKPVFSSALELLLNLYCEHVRRGQRPWFSRCTCQLLRLECATRMIKDGVQLWSINILPSSKIYMLTS